MSLAAGDKLSRGFMILQHEHRRSLHLWGGTTVSKKGRQLALIGECSWAIAPSTGPFLPVTSAVLHSMLGIYATSLLD